MLSSVASCALLRRSTASASRMAGVRAFASDSHDDFAPQRKVVEGQDQAFRLIQEHVQGNSLSCQILQIWLAVGKHAPATTFWKIVGLSEQR